MGVADIDGASGGEGAVTGDDACTTDDGSPADCCVALGGGPLAGGARRGGDGMDWGVSIGVGDRAGVAMPTGASVGGGDGVSGDYVAIGVDAGWVGVGDGIGGGEGD